jgi:hypothetical protein
MEVSRYVKMCGGIYYMRIQRRTTDGNTYTNDNTNPASLSGVKKMKDDA